MRAPSQHSTDVTRRVVFLILVAISLATAMAWIGLDRGLPDAPWGDEAWRWRVVTLHTLSIVFLPWQPMPEQVLSPAIWARWVWVLVLVALALAMVAPVARERHQRWRIRRSGGHILIAGVDDFAAGMARAWIRDGRSVLVLEADPILRRAAQRLGAATMREGLEHPKAFELCNLARAERVVLVAGDDSTCLRDAIRCAEWAGSKRNASEPALQMMVRVDDLLLRTFAESRLVRAAMTSVVEARILSAAQVAARGLLRDSPWRSHRGQPFAPQLIVGTTSWAEAVLVQALLVDVQCEHEKPSWMMVGTDASAFVQQIEGRLPGLREVAQIDALDVAPQSALSELRRLFPDRPLPTVWCFCLGGDSENIGAATAWYDAWHHLESAGQSTGVSAPLIVIRLSSPNAAELSLSMWPDALVRVFGTASGSVEEALTGEHLDGLARGGHESYLQDAVSKGEVLGSRSALHNWRSLPEYLRDDNRVAADHHYVKFHDRQLVALPGAGAQPVKWSPGDLEHLARMEHARWVRQRKLAGWKWAVQRDDAKKLHPSLLTYDELDPGVQQLDRDQVLQLPHLLQKSGLAIHHLKVAIVAGQPSPWAFTTALEQTLSTWLRQWFANADEECGLLWVVADSALAFRAAEICIASQYARIALVITETLPNLLARQPNDAARQRIRKIISKAVETLQVIESSPTAEWLLTINAKVRAGAALYLQVMPGVVRPPCGVSVLDADGRWHDQVAEMESNEK